MTVPLIDISRAAAPDGFLETAAAIGAACRTHGFFYITGHEVPESLIDALTASASRFFDLSLPEKMQISMDLGGSAWRGYFPPEQELTSGIPDQKEGIYFGTELDDSHPLVAAGTPMHGRNLWPEAVPEMRNQVLMYLKEMFRIGQSLMELIGVSLGLERGYFRKSFSDEPTQLFRIFNYPQTDQSRGWGVGEHTDYGFLTILWQDSSGGLEIKSNGEWIQAPSLPGTFVCNIGDMLDLLTGGEFLSTPHRVRNPAAKDRLSMPFFFDPGFNARLEKLPLAKPLRQVGRWDGKNLYDLEGCYGDYLLGKVSKVFPHLFNRITLNS
mgnify:CR=1 FL=1